MAFHLITALALGANMLSPPAPHHSIPAWARKYNVNCNHCHYPAVPRLNAKGYEFKWAGYRMAEEIGEDQEVKQISDYVAARFRLRYVIRKTESAAPDVNSFSLSDATLFAGGPIGKNYGAFFEFEHAPDEVELVNNVYGVWGKAKQYAGARVGLMHWLLRGAVAGFDRPTGISTPIPLANPLTQAAVPFAFSTDQLGVEAFFVNQKNRLSFEVLNGISAAGKGDENGSPGTKDVVIIDQLLYDAQGSGLTAVAYFGAIRDLDPAIVQTTHYRRFGISANKLINGFEALGGYVYGKDDDLPVGVTFTAPSVTGSGFWGYAGYTFPSSSLTTFGRYEYVNSNKDVANTGTTRFVLGGVLPVNIPEYFRMALEYTLDKPRASGSLKRHGLAAEVMVNF